MPPFSFLLNVPASSVDLQASPAAPRDGIQEPARHVVFHLLVETLGQEHGLLVFLCEAFQVFGELHGLPDDGVLLLLFGADVADGHHAVVKPQAVLELRLPGGGLVGVEGNQALAHLQAGLHRCQGVVLLAGGVHRAPKKALIASPI